ncbi:hypothetical protein ES707_14080 [subsurface metagenome]
MPKPTELDDEQLIEHIGEFVDELNERLEKRQGLIDKLKEKIEDVRIFTDAD